MTEPTTDRIPGLDAAVNRHNANADRMLRDRALVHVAHLVAPARPIDGNVEQYATFITTLADRLGDYIQNGKS